jgi:hypothetical protein
VKVEISENSKVKVRNRVFFLNSQFSSYMGKCSTPNIEGGHLQRAGIIYFFSKCGTYTQWSFTQPQRRMKSYYSQVNGWNWRTSS